MRFVSKSANLRIPIRNQVEMNLASGAKEVITRGLTALFQKNILSPSEVDIGVASFRHTGLPIDRDTETHISPRHRISGFDTELEQERLGWTDEEREIVEQKLLADPANGIDFIHLTPAAIPAPWPTYDTTAEVDIVTIAKATGTVENALVYEKANAKRAAVIAALEGDEAQEAEEDGVLIEA